MKSSTSYKPGQSGNPAGRARGSGVSGRTLALQMLDRLLAEEGNLEKLRAALQQKFDADPAGFFAVLCMPLLPKESLLKLESVDKAPVRIIMETAEEQQAR